MLETPEKSRRTSAPQAEPMRKPISNGPVPYKAAIRRLRPTFVYVGVFSAAVNLLMLTGPVYMLQIYDRVLSSASVPTLLGLFTIVVVLYAFLGAYDFFRKRLLSRASYRLDALTGDLAFEQRMQADPDGERQKGNSLRDLEIVRSFLSSPAILGLFDLPWIPIFLGVVFLIHPVLGWVTLVGAGVVVVVALVNEGVTRRYTTDAMARDAEERAFVETIRRNAEPIHALGMQPTIAARWRQLHGAGLASAQQGGDRSEFFASFSRAFRLLLQSLLLTWGAYLALQQEITAGMIVATSILSGRALAPVDQVIGNWRSIARAAHAHRELKKSLGTKAGRRDVALPAPKGAVTLAAVSKLMPGATDMRERPGILDRVSFQLAPGEGLGVIGNSAAGKSSLARLLVGAWQPDSGEIRLDGATLNQWEPDELGRHIGYLPQTVEMLPGTISENISRFHPNADQEQVFTAARFAGVHDMILGMPKGYSTFVGHPDQPLSGGQVQRLALARALFGDPKLLVLDEPNAHLDAIGDQALKHTIEIMRSRGSTVIVMAHRPSALAAVNKVLILHKGQVAYFGDKQVFFEKNKVRPVSDTGHQELAARAS